MAETFVLKRQEDRCPHVYCKCTDCPDMCSLNDKICLLEEGLVCEEWEDIKKEWAEEEKL